MKNPFNKNAQKSEAEKFLDDKRVAYEKQPDGKIHVKADLILNFMGPNEWPDLNDVIVEGNLECLSCGLTSLRRLPQSVGGNFVCVDNKLTSLVGAPLHFKKLVSDFGEFDTWQDIPVHIRLPGFFAQMREENAAVAAAEVIAKEETKAAEEVMLERQCSPALHRDLVVRPQPLVPRK